MIVLDASALVDVIVDRPAKEHVLAHLDQPIVGPSHQLAEVLFALARLVRADVITATLAREALDTAAALDQEHIAPRPRHLRRVLDRQDRIRVLAGYTSQWPKSVIAH